MKRQYRIWIAVAVLSFMTACGRNNQGSGQESTTQTQTETEKPEAGETTARQENGAENEQMQSGYRTGLGVVHRMQDSKDAEDADGMALVFGCAAAVVLDEEGKIADCFIDEVEAEMGFTQDGRLTKASGTKFPTKKEMPEESVQTEWLKKASALEESVLGKTREELADGEGMEAGDYVEAIVKACDAAAVIGTGEGDKLGLGIVTDMKESKDAAEGNDGQCQAYSYYVVTTANEEGRLTGVILDSAQPTVTFDSDGKITSDLQAEVKTKKELGDSYGMRPASGIGKEWYEQAEAMEAYAKGKTLEELEGIAVTAEGRPKEPELASSVTISIGRFLEGFRLAVESAQ